MAIAMLAACLLIVGGIKLSLARDTRARGMLMIVAGLVLAGNVLIWTL